MNEKIAIFSDLHLGIHQNSTYWHTIALNWIKDFKKYLILNNIKNIYFLGDFFHHRDELNLLTLDTSSVIFDLLSEFKITMIPGNHDCFFKNTTDINSLSIFKGRNNITIYNKITILNLKDKIITFCPWGTNIADIPDSDIIFGHFELQNFKMNGFKICDAGDDVEILSSKSKLIISGHFHLNQNKKIGNSTIIYIGNPFEMDIGDAYQKKGFYILDMVDNSFEFIENTESPKHIKIFLSKLVSTPNIEILLQKILPNTIVKLVVDKNISTEHLDILMAYLNNFKLIELSIDYDVNYNKIKVENDNDIDLSGIVIEQAIEEFINLLEISNKKEVIDYTIQLYNRSKL